MKSDTAKGKLNVHRIVVGVYETNVYLLTCPAGGEGVIIDAAGDAARILEAAGDAKIRYILQTHGHHDHTGALADLRRALGAPIGIHLADADMLPEPPDFHLADGNLLRFGGCDLRAIHTPGHTPGGICFYDGTILFSGDTLFPGGPGATQHALGSFSTIIESIRTKLLVLPDETRVLPGHGAETTIGTERPFLQDWIDRGW